MWLDGDPERVNIIFPYEVTHVSKNSICHIRPACDHAARVAFDMSQRYNAEIVVFHVLVISTLGYSQIVVDVATRFRHHR